MSARQLFTAVVGVLLLSLALVAAESPFIGTWKINASKSKLEGSGVGSNGTLRIDSEGSGLKLSVQGTTTQGQPNNFTYQATLDGKFIKVTGSPLVDEVSTKRVNDHTISATGKKDGKVAYTDRRVVSADGKSMTISRSGTNPQGQSYKATIVFDKQ